MPKPAGHDRVPGCAAGSESSSAVRASIFADEVTLSGRWLAWLPFSSLTTLTRTRRAPDGIVSLAGRGVTQMTCASARTPVEPSLSCTTLMTSHRVVSTSAIAGHANVEYCSSVTSPLALEPEDASRVPAARARAR